jgi:DNA-binding NtrC family response regulator
MADERKTKAKKPAKVIKGFTGLQDYVDKLNDTPVLPDMSIIEGLQARVERLEGVVENKLWFVSTSSAMQPANEAIFALRKEAFKGNDNQTVLIVGPIGAGHMGAAWAIRQGGARLTGPWVTLQCAGLTDELADVEFFGKSEEGLKGAFALAQGGTLYLENVDHLSVEFQTKLADVLSTKTYKDSSLEYAIAWDIQIIGSVVESAESRATPREISYELKKMLGQVMIHLPTLVEHKEDLFDFAQTVATRFLADHGVAFEGFHDEVNLFMNGYNWPGNIAELVAFVEMLVSAYAGKGLVRLPSYLRKAQGVVLRLEPKTNAARAIKNAESFTKIKKRWSLAFEKEYFTEILMQTQGNVSAAARITQLDRSNFLRLLKRHALKPDVFRPRNMRFSMLRKIAA